MDENSPILVNSTMCLNGQRDTALYSSTGETDLDNVTVIPSNRRKWILLSLFCLLAFLQSAVFVAWMPISNSVLKAFGPDWSASTLAWQINLATIANPFIQWPVWKAIHKYDLSRALRWGAAFPLFLSTGLHCTPNFVAISNETFKWLSFTSFFLIGLVGVVFFSSITRFSSLWFPPSQRTTATGLSCTFANLGALLPSVVGPIMVTDPNSSHVNSDVLQSQIHNYLLMYFALASVLFIVFFIYFPSESIQPLAIVDLNGGQLEEVSSVKNSLLKLIRMPNVLAVMLVYSLNSLTHVWGSTLLTLTLAPLRISQSAIGIMTIASILVTALLTILLSRLADLYFQLNLKKLLMFLLPFHAISMIVFSVCILTADPEINNEVVISVLYVICLASLNTGTPLLFELGCELSHPVSEEIVAGTFDQMVNGFSIVFHFLFTYIANTSEDFSIILYLLMFLPCITFAFFGFVKEDYKRSKAESDVIAS